MRGGKIQVSRYLSQFKLPKGIFLQENPRRGMLFYYYLPAIKCLCSDVTHIQKYSKKTTMKKCSSFSGKYFYWFLVHIYSSNKQYLLRLWRVERILIEFFGFRLKGWMKTTTIRAFLWSFFKSCALSHLFSSSIIPQRERVMKSQGDPDGLKLWIPWSLVRITRKGNICSLVTALPRRGN